MRFKILIAAAVLLMLAALGIWYLQADHFQRRLHSALVSRVERATGMNCRIAGISLDVLRGRIEIRGLELSPRAREPGLAALSIDEVRATLSISSFRRLRVRLDELKVLRPRLELIAGGRGSSWNPRAVLNTLKFSLRLEAARVSVQDGRLDINDRSVPFNLSLEDLDCAVRYAAEVPSYRIRLAYGQSRFFYKGRDIDHGLELDADLSMQGLDIESFRFRREASLLNGSGSLKDWNSPALLIRADGSVDAGDLIIAHPSLHEGRGKTNVRVEFRHDKNGVYSSGRFWSADSGYRTMSFRDLAGDYEISRDVLYLRNVKGRVGGGTFRIGGEMQLREGGKAPNRVEIVARAVPVGEAARLLNLPAVNFENTADSETTLIWGPAGRPLRADCSVILHGLTEPSSALAKGTLLGGKMQFTVYGSDTVRFSSLSLDSPYTSVQLSGGQGSLFHVRLSTVRPAEPIGLIAGFSPPAAELIAKHPELHEMAGSYEFAGDVRIKSAADIEYEGSVTVKDGRWRSFTADRLSARARFGSSRLELGSLSVHSGAQSVEGDLDLDFAGKGTIPDFRFSGALRRISLASVRDFAADAPPIDGALDGSGSVRHEAGVWEGEGQFTVRNGSYQGEPFDNLKVRLRTEDRTLRLIAAEASRGPAHLSADGQVGLSTRQLDLKLKLENVSLEEIPLVRERNLPLQGRARVSGAIKGSLENPSFSGPFELEALRYASRDLGRGKGRIDFNNGTVSGNANIRSEYGSFMVQAEISSGAGYPGRAQLEFENLDIRKILPGETPPYLQEISSALKGKIEADGKFEDPDGLRIRGEVDGARFKIHDYELRNDGGIAFTVLNRNFRAAKIRFIGEGTGLVLSGTIPLDDSPRLDLTLSGNLNLRLLEGLEDKLRAGGEASINIRASGPRQNPQIIGRATLQDARFEHPGFPFRMSAIQGDVVFSRNLIRLENVRGAAASGTVKLSGVFEHQNAVLRSINMGISVRNARLLYPKDFRSAVNAELMLSGNRDFQIISGDIDVIRSEYLRSFNLVERLAGRGATPSGPATTDPALMGLRFNVEIRSDGGLVIDNELAKLRGNLRLSLRGTPAYPSLTGRAEAVEGTIFFRGSRFEILHAAADFVDRNRINPVFEVRAEADVKSHRLILDATGDFDRLNMNVTSDPPMSTVDILSLLTTGKTEISEGQSDTAASRRQAQMAGISAASVLSENLTGVIGKRVQRIFGLESFRVDPFLAGVENDPTARVTISERISKDLVVTFSRNLTTSKEQIVVIEYDIGKGVSVVATRDENGKFGLDFRLRTRLR